jgi:putative intracellular protease/amidase
MKRKAYVLVFDGLADWEPAHVLPEIANSGKFEVVTVGFSPAAVRSMGGFKILPDITLDEVRPDEASIMILPGGDMWAERSYPELIALLHQLHAEGAIIAAICGATLEIVRSGLTGSARHTSNDRDWLKSVIPDYQDEARYVDAMAVSDNNVITANGLGSVEFAREIIGQLGIYDADDTQRWYEMFKHGKFQILNSAA